jgi:SAM-dependent methyltransferase/tetratricopeptide (TPR) repeat protein
MTTIGLCMIVKNEAKVILRCLDSVRPLLDFVLIEDTGSTDGTQTIIREWLDRAGLPGIVIDEPWRDFAYNRTHALAKLREHPEIDYAFMIDADDRIEIDPDLDVPAFKAALTADFYDVEIHHGPIKHHRPHIYRNLLNFSYRGVVHEFVDAPEGPVSRATAAGFHIVIVGGGARSQDTAKFQRDAALLERALETEQDAFLISRYTFYLAQSYRDFGEKEKALARYLARAEMGFWDEEVYVSLNEAAKLQADTGRPAEEVLATYQRAIDKVPGRAEAFHGASLYCRLNGRNEEGYQIAKRGLALTEAPSPAGLFVQQWIHEYGLLDEYAINAYWSGHYRECLDASLRILSDPNCPEGQRKRFLDNARFAAGKLPRMPNLGSLGTESFIEQHALVPPRPLRSHLVGSPRVLVAILAKQKEPSLPLYLDCIEALDYPKSSIVLYIRTNNNTDGTERILREWVARVDHLYAGVEFDAEDVATRVEQFGVHEWNATRFSVLGRIRNISLRRALEHDCAFYFVADVDNFVRPCTLRELVALDLPIVAPLLRSINPGTFYSNYHAEIDANGYYKDCDQYHWVLNRWVRGVVEMPLVHCTYLVRTDVLNDLTYEDGTDRFEYVVFSDSARKSGVLQYIDNRQIYGYITFDEGGIHYVAGGIEQARTLLDADMGTRSDADLGTTSSRERLATSQSDTEARIREKFSEIYQKNEWDYGSGPGSLPINNIGYMEFVQSFIENSDIKSIVDFGCGDWQFSRLMNWHGASYVGFDLVPDVIESNRKAFARPGISFEVFKALDEVPVADLLLCKDVFQHLPNDLIREYLATFKRKFKFLLITNDDEPDSLLNSDIQAGSWRPIRLDCPPFSESTPIVFSRTDTVGGRRHKTTCLIDGNRDGEYLLPVPALATSGDSQAGLLPEDRDSRHVAGGIEQARTLPDADLGTTSSVEQLVNPPITSRAEPEVGRVNPPPPVETMAAHGKRASEMSMISETHRDRRVEDAAKPAFEPQSKRFTPEGFSPFSEMSNSLPDLSDVGQEDGDSGLPGGKSVECYAEDPVLEGRITLLVHQTMVEILDSLVLMLADGLREISMEPEVIHELPPGFSGRAIVLGANFFSTAELERLGPNSIVFNIENTTSQFLTDEYRQLLRKFRVWDFNESNAASLAETIQRPVHYLRTFYVERLARIAKTTEQDIDVLFYGSFNDRRSEILNGLRARGLRVEAVFRVFGAQLEQLIARSKVVINIHFYDNGRLEMIRLFDLLANGRAVVSEVNPGELVDADLADAFIAAPYERLVEVTEALVRDPDRRRNVANAGFRVFSHRNPNTILREALAWSKMPVPPRDAVIGSGKMYDPNLFNIDIDERWHPDIVADIADTQLFTREFSSRRFDKLRLQHGWFDSINASHVLEHVPDLVTAMTNCLELLTDGGLFRITVPYDLSYGAWQDPTHVHAFNERSWLYYCEWYWYLGWTDGRFELIERSFRNSPWGDTLAARGVPQDEILRSPRAVDEMHVVLCKRPLTEAERAHGHKMRGDMPPRIIPRSTSDPGASSEKGHGSP